MHFPPLLQRAPPACLTHLDPPTVCPSESPAPVAGTVWRKDWRQRSLALPPSSVDLRLLPSPCSISETASVRELPGRRGRSTSGWCSAGRDPSSALVRPSWASQCRWPSPSSRPRLARALRSSEPRSPRQPAAPTGSSRPRQAPAERRPTDHLTPLWDASRSAETPSQVTPPPLAHSQRISSSKLA